MLSSQRFFPDFYSYFFVSLLSSYIFFYRRGNIQELRSKFESAGPGGALSSQCEYCWGSMVCSPRKPNIFLVTRQSLGATEMHLAITELTRQILRVTLPLQARLIIACSSQKAGTPWIDQFRYIKIYSWHRGLGEENKIKEIYYSLLILKMTSFLLFPHIAAKFEC